MVQEARNQHRSRFCRDALEVGFRLQYSGPRLHILSMRYWKRRGLKEKSDAQGPDPGSNLILFCGSLQ
jgi:hypothetical protein